jgi:hypothetical protein|tara:strand:- start:885 stop:1292 length:408 start_codon:yes stop_codon:yes gene_type:complete
MSDKKSLVELAYRAGFNNLHGMAGGTTWLIGTIMSDKYEIIMFRGNDDMKTQPTDDPNRQIVTDKGTVDVFGIVDPYEPDSCALYRLRTQDLLEAKRRFESQPLNCWIGLDKKESLYKGDEAVAIVKGLASVREE